MADVAPTIVLGCTKDIRHLMPPVLELLASRGLQVEVVSGLELRDDAPVLAAKRLPGACFVLFADSQPTVMERARLRLRHAGVDASRIASLPVDWRGPADVLAAIEAMGVPVTPGPRRATLGNLLPAPPESPAFPPPHTIAELEVPRRAPLLSASVPVLEHGDDDDDDGWVRRRRRRLLGIGGAAAAVLLAVLAMVAFTGDDDDDAADTVTVADAETPELGAWSWLRPPQAASLQQAVEATPPGATDPPPAAVPPADVSAPAQQPEIPTGTAVAAANALPSPIAPLPTPPGFAEVPASPVPGTDAIVIEPEAEPEPEPGPSIDHAEMEAIYAGLVAQRFRALDILLVAPEPRKKVRKRFTKSPARMSWSQANTYCEALAVANVDDWRLPQVGELGSITDGELIAAGKFWSQTQGDTFGRSRVVWNTQTARMGTAPVAWKGGRVVCVRTMARTPEAPPTP